MIKELSRHADDLKLHRVLLGVGQDIDESELERQLLQSPEDLITRAMLVNHYGLRCQFGFLPSKEAELRLQHILWFIEHVPESRFVSDTICSIPPGSIGDGEIQALWLDLLSKGQSSLMKNMNAFLFFYEHDAKRCSFFTEWFKKCPSDPWVC